MSLPLIVIPGIASDAEVWRGMPPASVIMPQTVTIEAMAEEALAHAPPRFALAGYSMGGYIALAMMARAGERIERLALISTSARADDGAALVARERALNDAAADFDAFADRLARVTLDQSQWSGPLPAVMAAMIKRAGKDNFIRQQRATMARPDRRALLPRINVPTLVLTGEADRVVNPERSRESAAAIPAARLVSIPNCGHAPMLEKPAETEAALRDWLS